MASVKDEGVCVRQWDWSETSQTLVVFTREHGMVRCVAKGSKRAKSAFSGGVELLTRGEAVMVVKATGLSTLASWDLLETMSHVRGNLATVYAGMYAAEVAQSVVAERDPHAGLYEALVRCLRGLHGARRVHGELVRFQWAALVEAGYEPRIGGGEEDHRHADERGWAWFDAERGGVADEDAPDVASGWKGLAPLGEGMRGRGEGKGASKGRWKVRRSTLALLGRLRVGEAEGERGADGGAGDRTERETEGIRETEERASGLLAVYLRHILGRELATAREVYPAMER